LANIEMKHIDNDIIRIIGKGNKEREAFLTEKTKMHLNEWIEEVRGSEPGALFVRIYQDGSLASLFKESGEPNCLSSQAIYFILKKKSEQLEMQAFTPHDFRRTLASTMLENGEDLSTVKDTLGHASISTTQRYDKRAKSRIKSAVERTGF
jgi:integrase/recombinase XerD